MRVEKNLGKKCKYTDRCPLYAGEGLPANISLTIYRNVYCYRGKKGWSNCDKFHEFEKERLDDTGT